MTDSYANVFGALAKAQQQFKEPETTASVNFGKTNFKYAPLHEIRKCTQKALNDNGLVLMQFPVTNAEGYLGMNTLLGHESGESINGTFYSCIKESDPKKQGAIITYFRRYGWLAICGLAPVDEGDMDDMTGDLAPKKPGPVTTNQRELILTILSKMKEFGDDISMYEKVWFDSLDSVAANIFIEKYKG